MNSPQIDQLIADDFKSAIPRLTKIDIENIGDRTHFYCYAGSLVNVFTFIYFPKKNVFLFYIQISDKKFHFDEGECRIEDNPWRTAADIVNGAGIESLPHLKRVK